MEIGATLIFIGEITGTIVFALAGAMVAIEQKLDYFGIVFLALTTATGGGIIRDLLLGNLPPATFLHPIYICIAAITTVPLVILLAWRGAHKSATIFAQLKWPIAFLDALGLGIFTVVGIDTTFAAGQSENVFLCVFIGMITGTGGGILRDIFALRTPSVLKQDIYALVSIGGGILYFYLRSAIYHAFAMIVAIAFVVIVRMIVVRFDLHLPVAGIRKEDEQHSHISLS